MEGSMLLGFIYDIDRAECYGTGEPWLDNANSKQNPDRDRQKQDQGKTAPATSSLAS